MSVVHGHGRGKRLGAHLVQAACVVAFALPKFVACVHASELFVESRSMETRNIFCATNGQQNRAITKSKKYRLIDTPIDVRESHKQPPIQYLYTSTSYVI